MPCERAAAKRGSPGEVSTAGRKLTRGASSAVPAPSPRRTLREIAADGSSGRAVGDMRRPFRPVGRLLAGPRTVRWRTIVPVSK